MVTRRPRPRRALLRPLAALVPLAVTTALLSPTGSANAAGAAPAPAGSEAAGSEATGVARGYVVVLDDTAAGRLGSTAKTLVAPLAGTVTATFGAAVHGFAAELTPAAAQTLAAVPGIASVEPDATVRVARTQRRPLPSLDRIDQSGRRLDGLFRYPDRAGRGAHVYVVDTGLSGHSEFRGRVGEGRNFVGGLLSGPNPNAWADCDGHGTHVASSAVGTRWGVAKRATVHGVRVLDCAGAGTVSSVVSGLDWVARNARRPAVVNLSLSGPRSSAIENAVRGLVRRGISVVAAAGNSNTDACRSSPAAVPAALTVGATNRADGRAPFSNFGRCVDIFAPGVDIVGARAGTTSGSLRLSGTSMASPLVAGALAMVRAVRPGLSPAQAEQRLLQAATTGVVRNRGAGSPNRLLRLVDEPPRAAFGFACTGTRCRFTAKPADDIGIRAYRWSFTAANGRTTTAKGRTVTRTLARGTARATLRVVDTSGQRATRTRSVTVG